MQLSNKDDVKASRVQHCNESKDPAWEKEKAVGDESVCAKLLAETWAFYAAAVFQFQLHENLRGKNLQRTALWQDSGENCIIMCKCNKAEQHDVVLQKAAW